MNTVWVTLSLTVNETLKRLSPLPGLMHNHCCISSEKNRRKTCLTNQPANQTTTLKSKQATAAGLRKLERTVQTDSLSLLPVRPKPARSGQRPNCYVTVVTVVRFNHSDTQPTL